MTIQIKHEINLSPCSLLWQCVRFLAQVVTSRKKSLVYFVIILLVNVGKFQHAYKTSKIYLYVLLYSLVITFINMV